MDFHLATPDGDVYLFSYEDGRIVDTPPAPAPAAGAPDQHLPQAPQPHASIDKDQVGYGFIA